MFTDTGVEQQVDHIGVDVRQVFERHESPEPGGAGSFMKLDESLLLREGRGPQLHFVLLQNLVNESALDCRKQHFLQHQHRQENCPGPNDEWKGAALLGRVLI